MEHQGKIGEETMTTTDTLEHVLADFASSSQSYRQYLINELAEGKRPTSLDKVLAKAEDAPFSFTGPHGERLALYENGLVWFANGEGNRVTPVGKPEDYLTIRDDAAELKNFLRALLDKGPIYYGTSYWNQDGDWKPSEYAIWLYKNSAHEPFRRNMEHVVGEMLKEEVERKRVFPQECEERVLQEASERTRKQKEEFYKTDNPRKIVQAELREWRGKRNTEQGGLKSFFQRGKNFWPLADATREKSLSRRERDSLVGELDAAQWQYRKLSTMVIDRLAELSLQPVYSLCRQEATKRYQQQYQRLIGLLEIITAVGTPQNGFAAAFDLLAEKAQQKCLYEHPNIVSIYPGQDDNIYNNLLQALAAVQPDDRLASFWLEQIRTDLCVEAVYLSEYGFLKSYTEREAQLPAVVRALKDRQPAQNPRREKANLHYGSEQGLKEKDIFTGFGWLRNGLFSSKKHLLLRQKGIFLDKETFTLHVSNDIQPEQDNLRITFDRYTSEGKSTPITFLYDKKGTEQYNAEMRQALWDCVAVYEYAKKRGLSP